MNAIVLTEHKWAYVVFYSSQNLAFNREDISADDRTLHFLNVSHRGTKIIPSD